MRIVLLTAGLEDAHPGGCPAAGLVSSLAGEGNDVTVVTGGAAGASAASDLAGLTISRVGELPPILPRADALAWRLQFNLALAERATAVLTASPADVIHAHGAGVAHAAVTVRRSFGLPLVAAIGRGGRRARTDIGLAEQIEWWLASEASRTIVGSASARAAVTRRYQISQDRVVVIGASRARSDAARARSLARRVLDVYRAASADRRTPRLTVPSGLRARFEELRAIPVAR